MDFKVIENGHHKIGFFGEMFGFCGGFACEIGFDKYFPDLLDFWSFKRIFIVELQELPSQIVKDGWIYILFINGIRFIKACWNLIKVPSKNRNSICPRKDWCKIFIRSHNNIHLIRFYGKTDMKSIRFILNETFFRYFILLLSVIFIFVSILLYVIVFVRGVCSTRGKNL